VFLPLLAAAPISWLAWNRLREYYALENRASDEVTGFLAEAFGAVQAVKLAGAAGDVVDHFAALNRTRRTFAVRWRVVEQSMNSMTNTAVAFGIGIVLLLAGHAMARHTFTVGDFALFVYFLQFITEAATGLGSFLGDYAQQSIFHHANGGACSAGIAGDAGGISPDDPGSDSPGPGSRERAS
jgi:ATP-binding cassette subfamily B protein